jgi:hypothetical protein
MMSTRIILPASNHSWGDPYLQISLFLCWFQKLFKHSTARNDGIVTSWTLCSATIRETNKASNKDINEPKDQEPSLVLVGLFTSPPTKSSASDSTNDGFNDIYTPPLHNKGWLMHSILNGEMTALLFNSKDYCYIGSLLDDNDDEEYWAKNSSLTLLRPIKLSWLQNHYIPLVPNQWWVSF